jgi:hypothetical protein
VERCKIKDEEELKDEIFNIYIKFKNETASDRRQVYYSQLWKPIYKWCLIKEKNRFGKDRFGEEIGIVIKSITNEESKANVPQVKDEFFKYLFSSIITAEAGYHRKYDSGTIKIPKEKMSKLKNMENVLRMEESNLGRKLTDDERSYYLDKWFRFNKQEYQKYIDLYNKIFIESISYISDDGDETDVLNMSVTPLFGVSNNPQDEYLTKLNTEAICNAVNTVLNNRQERARPCLKALFTAFCLDNIIEYQDLYHILDNEIIEDYKKDKKPTKYEIYQKYHPDVKQSSAEAIASKNLSDFIKDLKIYLEDNNPEIFI